MDVLCKELLEKLFPKKINNTKRELKMMIKTKIYIIKDNPFQQMKNVYILILEFFIILSQRFRKNEKLFEIKCKKIK